MKVKLPPLEVNSESPFAHDRLNRQKFVQPLDELLRSDDQSLVLSVEAPWGWGKTTFLRMWKAELAGKNAPVISFNAWETDFSGTPLIAVLAELNAGLSDLKPPAKSRVALEGLKTAGAALLRRAVPLAIRVGTSGLVSLSDDLSEDVRKATVDLAQRVGEDFVASYSTAKASLEDFKHKLTTAAVELRTESTNNFPLTIFVDELDRCRPDYAVEMLEVIKHLFDVPGVSFVLAVHREQLENSVRTLYGTGINADDYLRRFIDLSFRLPAPDTEAFVPSVMARLGLDAELANRVSSDRRYKAGDPGEITKAFTDLFQVFAMSLRTQEQVLGQLSLVLRMTPADKELFPEFLALLLTLHAGNSSLYHRYVTGQIQGDAVLEWISEDTNRRSFLKSNTGIGIEGWLRMCGRSPEDSDPVAEYRVILDDESASREDREHASRLVQFCDWINNHVLHYGAHRGSGIVDSISRKIALLEHFSATSQAE